MRTARLVTIGQCWQRKRGGMVLKVRNVYRTDRQVLAVDQSGERCTVTFTELRRYYRLL